MSAAPGDAAGTQAAIRGRLTRTWYALFAHHPRLRPIQLAGIPALLDRRECLLCAPTAGGKTEALVAAALEDLAAKREPGPRALFVCPTRALVNDVCRRLGPVAERLGLKVERHTADHRAEPSRPPDPASRMRPRAGAHRDLLVTTPEGLDSWLARRPAALKTLRWALLDELHLVAGTARGDQLAALVSRLRAVVQGGGRRITIAGASATLPQAEDVAARYLVDPVVIRVPAARRELDLVARPARTVAEVAVALGASRGKTLMFTNARNAVERLSHALRGQPPFGDAVFAHHGSLTRDERERVEAQFLARTTALCVATSTLELGIDIGDVDRVALYGPPPDVSSFLQRVGRAGRRSGQADVLLLAQNHADALRFAFLLDRAAAEDLCGDLGAYKPATVVQQAGSLLFQNPNRTLPLSALLARLPPYQAAHWTLARLDSTLLARPDLFTRGADGVYRAADGLQEAFTRGRMHSQIVGDAGLTVYDALTGRALGHVHEATAGDTLTLGGRGGHVLGTHGKDVRVQTTDFAAPARFKSRPPPVKGARDARAYLEFLGVPPGCGGLLPGMWCHGLGAARGRVISTALKIQGASVSGRSNPLVWWARDVPPPDVALDALNDALDQEQVKLGSATGQGPDFARLPEAERLRALRLALPPAELKAAWRALRWVDIVDGRVAERIAIALGERDE